MKAFPTLTAVENQNLLDRGIDIEQSFRQFLAEITGRDAEAVEELIEEAARDTIWGPLPTGAGCLSGRERQVLLLKAMGNTNQQVADDLCLSKDTVGDHVKHAIRKLEAENVTHAVVIALALGHLEDAA